MTNTIEAICHNIDLVAQAAADQAEEALRRSQFLRGYAIQARHGLIEEELVGAYGDRMGSHASAPHIHETERAILADWTALRDIGEEVNTYVKTVLERAGSLASKS